MDRRAFLGTAGWAFCPWRAWAAFRPPAPAIRRLKLFNAHTGESFNGPYRDEGGPSTSAGAELAEFLRDHHSDSTGRLTANGRTSAGSPRIGRGETAS